MDLGISGRVAIITGGSGGIGFATAKLLALEGVKLVLSDRQQADVDDAAGIIGGDAMAVAADVTSQADVDALVSLSLIHI